MAGIEVYSKYEIAGPLLIALPSKRGEKLLPVREYDPLKTRRVLSDFVQMREGNERTLKHFCKEWGLLLPGGGVASDWFWGHVRQARLVLDIAKTLRDGDKGGLESLMAGYRRPDGTVAMGMVGPEYGESHCEQPWAGPIETGKAVTAAILNLNLAVTYAVDPATLLLVPHVPDLRAGLYWHLAEAVSGGRLVRCKECGSVFPGTDKRQRFCPPPLGVATSLCGDRWRKRAARKGEGNAGKHSKKGE